MITRDIIQGFIDGHKLTHSDECIKNCLHKYLKEHHTYPQDDSISEKILSDLGSYKK